MTHWFRGYNAVGVTKDETTVSPDGSGTTATVWDFKVSTDGTVHIYKTFTVSAMTVQNALTTGSLTVQGAATVSGATGFTGAVSIGGALGVNGAVSANAANFAGAVSVVGTINVGSLFQATTTVFSSTGMTLRTTCYQMTIPGGTKVYVPYFVSLT